MLKVLLVSEEQQALMLYALGVSREAMDQSEWLRLKELVASAAPAPAPKTGLFAQVEDVDGSVTVRLHDSAEAAREAIGRSLDEYDDPDLNADQREDLTEGAREELREHGWCKIDLNMGHTYEVVEINDPDSLQLVARARPDAPAAHAAVPGLEGWVAADENTREMIPGAVYSRTLGGGDSAYATYDLTIVRDDSEMYPFIPMHGSVRMHGAPSAADAARMLMSYWADLPEDSKRVAVRDTGTCPRGG